MWSKDCRRIFISFYCTNLQAATIRATNTQAAANPCWPLDPHVCWRWIQKPKRSMLLACFNETVQQVLKSVYDLCWSKQNRLSFCKSRWTVIIVRTWSFINRSGVGWTTDNSQHWQPNASSLQITDGCRVKTGEDAFNFCGCGLKFEERWTGKCGARQLLSPLLSADTRTRRNWDITKSFYQKLSGCSSKSASETFLRKEKTAFPPN